MITCHDCQPPAELRGTTIADFRNHWDHTHGHLAGLPDDLTGPGQDWHTAAHTEVRRLARTGQDFQLWEVFRAVGDPPNHKTANGGFSQELEHLGLAHVVGYGPSRRPGSKGSAVAIWRGGRKPASENAA